VGAFAAVMPFSVHVSSSSPVTFIIIIGLLWIDVSKIKNAGFSGHCDDAVTSQKALSRF